MTASADPGVRKAPSVERRRAKPRRGLPPPVEIPDEAVPASLLGADDAPPRDGRLEGAVDDWPGIQDEETVPDEPSGTPER